MSLSGSIAAWYAARPAKCLSTIGAMSCRGACPIVIIPCSSQTESRSSRPMSPAILSRTLRRSGRAARSAWRRAPPAPDDLRCPAASLPGGQNQAIPACPAMISDPRNTGNCNSRSTVKGEFFDSWLHATTKCGGQKNGNKKDRHHFDRTTISCACADSVSPLLSSSLAVSCQQTRKCSCSTPGCACLPAPIFPDACARCFLPFSLTPLWRHFRFDTVCDCHPCCYHSTPGAGLQRK